jgi:transcription antitermination factor NusG
VIVQVPLFPCYVFVHIALLTNRIVVLRASGVISFVGIHGQGIPIPDQEIETLQALVNRNVPATPYPFVRTGQRVRIRGGCLEGVEGILVLQNEKQKVVVSVDTIQKSLAISIEGYDIEPV